MTPDATVLTLSALCLVAAALVRRQGWLMAGIALYTAQVGWIVHSRLDLLMPALAVAIGIGAAGLVVVVYREVSSQDDTDCHKEFKLSANRRQLIANIGS